MLNINKAEGVFYLPVHAEADHLDQAMKPLATEHACHLGEDGIDTIELKAPRHISDWNIWRSSKLYPLIWLNVPSNCPFTG